MNKYQEAIKELTDFVHSELDGTRMLNVYIGYIETLTELVDKETPKKLKSKTDKDGRLLWICPNCGDVYMKFWSDVETIVCRKYCDECGQKLYFGVMINE